MALPSSEISRDIFFNAGGYSGYYRFAALFFVLISITFFFFELRSLIRFWRSWPSRLVLSGRFQRFLFILKTFFLPQRIIRDGMYAAGYYLLLSGVAMLALSGGFIFLSWFLYSALHHQMVSGGGYQLLIFLSDLGGIFALLGVIILIRRIYGRNSSVMSTKSTGWIVAALIAAAFIADALRISLTGHPSYEEWAFVSYPLSFVLGFIPESAAQYLHFLIVWGMLSIVSVFAAFIIRSDSGIIIRILGNILRTDPRSNDGLFKYALDPASIEDLKMSRYETLKNVGNLRSSDVSNADACTGCGLCEERCPAVLTETPLSPKRLIEKIKHAIHLNQDSVITGKTISAEEIWSCTSCGACSEVCPSYINFNSIISRMKKELTLDRGVVPGKIKTNLINIDRCENIFGLAGSKADRWIVEAGAELFDGSQEYLFFAGCRVRSGEQRSAVKALFGVLKKSGIRAGVLSTESCCGDYALRHGDDLLFQQAAIKNMKAFASAGVKKIVTLCPHGFNALRKEYKLLAERLSDSERATLCADYEVVSHVELMDSLLAEGKLSIRNTSSRHITYHDPCYLSRHNDQYEPARNILRAIAGPYFVEMFNHSRNSICCGCFGNRDSQNPGEMARLRAREAHSSGAALLATACPHCLAGLSLAFDDQQLLNVEQKDIAEILLEYI